MIYGGGGGKEAPRQDYKDKEIGAVAYTADRSGNKNLMTTTEGQERLFDLTGMQEKVVRDPAPSVQLKKRFQEWNRQMVPPLWWPE